MSLDRTASTSTPSPSVGFLTVALHPPHGLFGGYLLLNAAARPLEFHCTAPVKPNRAQEILYGPTLEAFLYGEQIAATLLRQAKTGPVLVCTDLPPVLSARESVELPVTWVQAIDEESTCEPTTSPEAASTERFDCGRFRFAVPRANADDRQTVEHCVQTHLAEMDLCEPFDRIRQAIEEAQTAGG